MNPQLTSDSRSIPDVVPSEYSEKTSERELITPIHVITDTEWTTNGKPNYILEYIYRIESGQIVAGRRIKKIYQILKDKILNPEGQYIFDVDKGLRTIEFIETFCKHSKGKHAGKPFILELFQKAFVQALFGFVDKETGNRQYHEAFYLISRKQGKSTLASAIALYMLMADGESGQECYSVATMKDQARITFDEACNMVKQNSVLSKYIRKRKSDLYFEPNLSIFQPLSSDSNTLDGLNVGFCIIDECHAIKDRNLYEVMKQGTSSREQPLILITTTAGTVRDNIFDTLYDYSCKIIDGEVEDDRFLPILYELDDKNEYLDESMWEKSTPALGTIKSIDYLREQVSRAKVNESELKGVLCKDFNVLTTTSESWLELEEVINEDTFDLNDFKDFYAIGGVDLALVDDLSVATALILDPVTEIRYVEQMVFMSEEDFRYKTTNQTELAYQTWYDRGYITLTKGNITDYSAVTEWFNQLSIKYGIKVHYVHYDRWNASYWVQEMYSYNYKMIDTPQGAKTFTPAMQMLKADLRSKKVNYNNNPITRWCLFNTAVKRDNNNNIRPDKKGVSKDSIYKIDCTVSLLNAYVGLIERYDEFINAQPR